MNDCVRNDALNSGKEGKHDTPKVFAKGVLPMAAIVLFVASGEFVDAEFMNGQVKGGTVMVSGDQRIVEIDERGSST